MGEGKGRAGERGIAKCSRGAGYRKGKTKLRQNIRQEDKNKSRQKDPSSIYRLGPCLYSLWRSWNRKCSMILGDETGTERADGVRECFGGGGEVLRQ